VSTGEISGHQFGSDRPLLFNVDPWSRYGFAVPNWATQIGTLSVPIHGLADEIGKAQLFIMTHEDAGRLQAPSINTIMRFGKICNRIRGVLAGRKKEAKEVRIEGGHYTSDVLPWQIHPVPFFTSAIVRNRWMKEYNRLCMIALTNMYQHSDNNLPLTVTAKFAEDIWQYFNEIKILVGSELLQIAPEIVEDPNFIFKKEHYDLYDPASFTLNMERLDSSGPIQSIPTELDYRPLFQGYPSTTILPLLAQYAVGPDGEGFSGTPLTDANSAVGIPGGAAVAPPGSGIGQPQI